MPQPEHDTLSLLSSQLQTVLQETWEQEVLSRLPAETLQHAHQTGAFVRARGISSVGHLLRGLLAYVLCAPSLRHLGAWAVLIGLANVSHVAWQKRLRNARAFLRWLLSELLAVPAADLMLPQKRVLLIDATRLRIPGGCGDDWRVHFGYDLLAGRLLDARVSDRHTAEGFTLFALRPGDLVVADRGYSRRPQVAFALDAGAEVLVRLAVNQMPLVDEQGDPFEVLPWLQALEPGPHQRRVAFVHEGRRYEGRLLASPLPEAAAQRARAKERRRASKRQHQLQEATLFLCGWFLLWTSLPSAEWSDEQVRALYQARWQIELVIKRLKQVLKLAQLRGQTVLTNEATILAVLVAWSLLQSEVTHARQSLGESVQHWARAHQDESQAAGIPQPPTEETVSSWTILALGVQTLRQLVQGVWTMARLRACWPLLRRYLTHRRKRPHQESTIRACLVERFGASNASFTALFGCSGS